MAPRITVAHIAWQDDNAPGIGYAAVGLDADGFATPYGMQMLAGAPGAPSIAARCRTVHLVWSPDIRRFCGAPDRHDARHWTG